MPVGQTGMLRPTLLFLALASLTLGVFTIVPVPVWTRWELGILAGEFGHWFALLPLLIGGIAWSTRGRGVAVAAATTAISMCALALLLKPCVQAWRMGASLPDRLAAQLGPVAIARPPFSPTALFSREPEHLPIDTLTVPGGLLLDLYRPARPHDRAAPVVIVVHGGGWNQGDRKQLPQLNHWLARRGYAVAAISYRLAPEFRWPAQREDVLASIRFMKAHASELGIDPMRLVLLGRSAGGQIAQTVAYTAGDPAIRAVVALYAPSDLAFGYAHTHENDMIRSPSLMRQYLGGPPEIARATYDSASAWFQVSRDAPPTLLLHGENDTLVWHRHSVRLEARLAEHHVPCVFVSLPWAAHGFDFNLHGPGGQLTTFALEWFLAAVTK